MTLLLISLVSVFLLWMGALALCGFFRRFKRFLALWMMGLALNMIWMRLGLQAHPFEKHALFAQFSLSLYAVSTFAVGWFLQRIYRHWQNSRVEEPKV